MQRRVSRLGCVGGPSNKAVQKKLSFVGHLFLYTLLGTVGTTGGRQVTTDLNIRRKKRGLPAGSQAVAGGLCAFTCLPADIIRKFGSFGVV